jgi:hypothetical protein
MALGVVGMEETQHEVHQAGQGGVGICNPILLSDWARATEGGVKMFKKKGRKRYRNFSQSF